jgi:hypothetical protein
MRLHLAHVLQYVTLRLFPLSAHLLLPMSLTFHVKASMYGGTLKGCVNGKDKEIEQCPKYCKFCSRKNSWGEMSIG